MKSTLRILISSFLCWGLSWGSQASKLHFIALFSTKDTDIGPSAGVVYEKSATQFRDIASVIGYKFALYSVKGDTIIGQAGIKHVLENLQTSPQDIIIFHAFTHGFRYSGQASKFPHLLLSLRASTPPADYEQIGTEDIYKVLQNRQARFRLMMIEACNKEPINRTEPISIFEMTPMGVKNQPSIERYRDLFLKVRGNLILAAAKVGQEAWVPQNQYPSSFFRHFNASLNKLLTEEKKASWRRLFDEVNTAMQDAIRISNQYTKANIQQEPVCEFRDFVEEAEPLAVEPTSIAYTFDTATEEYLRLIKQADLQYSQRDYQPALAFYQKALRLKPYDYKAKQGAYFCQAMLGQVDFKELDSKELCGLLHNISRLPEFKSPQFAFAQYLYGIYHIKGKGGCPKDWQQARQWLKISYKNGIEGACHVWERVDRSRSNTACQNW